MSRADTMVTAAKAYGDRLGSQAAHIGYLEGQIIGLCRELEPPLVRETHHAKLTRLIREAHEFAQSLSCDALISDEINSVCDSLGDAAGYAVDLFWQDDEPNYGEGSGGDLAREAAAINRENDRRAA